jgi:hypothetical protein
MAPPSVIHFAFILLICTYASQRFVRGHSKKYDGTHDSGRGKQTGTSMPLPWVVPLMNSPTIPLIFLMLSSNAALIVMLFTTSGCQQILGPE